jgi:hypothetical protein
LRESPPVCGQGSPKIVRSELQLLAHKEFCGSYRLCGSRENDIPRAITGIEKPSVWESDLPGRMDEEKLFDQRISSRESFQGRP